MWTKHIFKTTQIYAASCSKREKPAPSDASFSLFGIFPLYFTLPLSKSAE